MTPVQLLDELAIAPSSAVKDLGVMLANTFGDKVGAIVEYEYFRRNNRPELPALFEHTDSPIVEQITRLLDGTFAYSNLSLQPVGADAITIPQELGRNASWTAFLKRAEVSARAGGFADSVAAGLAGAIMELADNIILHSRAPHSGIAAFSRTADRFEYTVADAGIGMLASLRMASEFRSLRDDLEALPLAVTPGVSRHGRGIGFGYGYRAVFLPLKAASGSVRLRSGEAVLHVAGAGPTPDQGRCSQRPTHQGVVVAVEISTRSIGLG